MLLEQNDIENCLESLYKKINGSGGVQIFLKNGSKFENWIQVELVEILKELFSKFDPEILIEMGNVDITIKLNGSVSKIEIKVFRLGGPGGNTMAGLKNDAEKLCCAEGIYQKLLLCVVFPRANSNFEKGWEEYEAELRKHSTAFKPPYEMRTHRKGQLPQPNSSTILLDCFEFSQILTNS